MDEKDKQALEVLSQLSRQPFVRLSLQEHLVVQDSLAWLAQRLELLAKGSPDDSQGDPPA